MRKLLIPIILFLGASTAVSAQEYDDMYFFKSDRKAVAKNFKPAPQPEALNNPSYEAPAGNKYANPEYTPGTAEGDYVYYEDQTTTTVAPENGTSTQSANAMNGTSRWLPSVSMNMGFGGGAFGPSSYYGLGLNWMPFSLGNVGIGFGMNFMYGNGFYPGGGFYDPFFSPYAFGNPFFGGWGYPYGVAYPIYGLPGSVPPAIAEGRTRTYSRPGTNFATTRPSPAESSATIRVPNRINQRSANQRVNVLGTGGSDSYRRATNSGWNTSGNNYGTPSRSSYRTSSPSRSVSSPSPSRSTIRTSRRR
ncbi:hypothetical protein [Algivirga pacifica]|uniref:Uncharacterized protein n=1 Tax=Algivirga pacifica TaxID=1162670 RepID=A0ABP9DNI7_9BACT